jgi:hypothetical protein
MNRGLGSTSINPTFLSRNLLCWVCRSQLQRLTRKESAFFFRKRGRTVKMVVETQPRISYFSIVK